MFFFSKKTTIAASGILQGATDHHSHILPGVDDGVETMDEALRILATYEALGIKHLWLTPHIMEDIPNTPQKLEARFLELKAAYTGNITLHLAAEYMIDNHLRKLLREVEKESNTDNNCPSFERGTSNAGNIAQEVQDNNNSPSREYPQVEGVEKKSIVEGVELLPIGSKGNHLLVETSYYNPPMRFRETLRQIKSLGYHPLLAHPERYMYMDNDEYQELHNEGVRFQLNLPSLCGAYGNTVKKRAQWLLKNGLYDAIGSDTHCEDAIEFITKCKLGKKEVEQVSTLLQNEL